MVDNRALGDLIPSRSLGDFKTKDKCPGAVIAQPDVRTFELKEGDKWLLLASDGLWDDLKVGRRRTGPRGLGGDSALLSPSSLPCPVASLASPLPSSPPPLPFVPIWTRRTRHRLPSTLLHTQQSLPRVRRRGLWRWSWPP